MHLARKYLAISLLVPLILLTACDENKVRRAALAASDFSVATSTIQQMEIKARDAQPTPMITYEEHQQFQQLLIEVAKSGKELDAAINVAHSKPQAVAALQASVDSTERLLNEGVLHIKNDQTRTNLQLFLASMRGLLATVASVVEGK